MTEFSSFIFALTFVAAVWVFWEYVVRYPLSRTRQVEKLRFELERGLLIKKGLLTPEKESDLKQTPPEMVQKVVDERIKAALQKEKVYKKTVKKRPTGRPKKVHHDESRT